MKVGDSEKQILVQKVVELKNNLDSFSKKINNQDLRRKIIPALLLNEKQEEIKSHPKEIDLKMLRELKAAL